MLKYFKKRRNEVIEGETKKSIANECEGRERIERKSSLRSSSSFCDEVFLCEFSGEDKIGNNSKLNLDYANIPNTDILHYQSRLSMTLQAIVGNPNCLSYFVQFLERKNALPLLKFYLDTENFKAAAFIQLKNERFLSAQNSRISYDKTEQCIQPRTDVRALKNIGKPEETICEEQFEEENTSVPKICGEDVGEAESNYVPELKTLCDLSMRKPLTDDEKSRIYAETNKQITKCYSHKLRSDSEFSLCSNSSNVSDEDYLWRPGQVSAASVGDAIAIYQKYLIDDAKYFLHLPVTILSQISLLLCKRDESSSLESSEPLSISAQCFDEAQQYVLCQLESDYLNDFLQSPFYCKYCLDLINSENVDSGSRMIDHENEELNIYDILYSEVTLFFFMEFLEQQDERECLDFWTAAINFRKSYTVNLESNTQTEMQKDAMIIYEKYFSLQSDCRLWMSDKLRLHVEERICALGHIAYCFDLPLCITARYLEQKFLKTFLKSQLFEKYIFELNTKVQEEVDAIIENIEGEMNYSNICVVKENSRRGSFSCDSSNKKLRFRHRKTYSDCSKDNTHLLSNKNISQHNTLLAMDSGNNSNVTYLKRVNSTGTNLNIDSFQLMNPNLLWRRKSSVEKDGLKFGHINAMGRYERDFQTADIFSNSGVHQQNWSLGMSSHKIKNAVRKLVNMPEEKMQEEIAWQVAEMIIKDVTSVTLSSNGNVNRTSELATKELSKIKPKSIE